MEERLKFFKEIGMVTFDSIGAYREFAQLLISKNCDFQGNKMGDDLYVIMNPHTEAGMKCFGIVFCGE